MFIFTVSKHTGRSMCQMQQSYDKACLLFIYVAWISSINAGVLLFFPKLIFSGRYSDPSVSKEFHTFSRPSANFLPVMTHKDSSQSSTKTCHWTVHWAVSI